MVSEKIAPFLTEPVATALSLRLTLAERKAFLLLGDLITLVLAGFASMWLWSLTRTPLFTFEFVQAYTPWILLLITLWLFIAWGTDLYNLSAVTYLSVTLKRLFSIATAILIGYLLLFFFIAQPNILPRRPLLYFVSTAFVFVTAWRSAYAVMLGQDTFRQKLLIIGANPAGQAFVNVVQSQPQSHFEVIGFIDDTIKSKLNGQFPVLGSTTKILDIAHQYQVDTIVYTLPDRPSAQIFQTLIHCQAAGLRVVQMPALYEALTGRVPIQYIHHDWLLPAELGGGQTTFSYHLFVRLIDWGFGIFAGLFLIFVGPIIALLIKLDSKGPIFYRQVRLGRGGLPFELLKFRSMTVDAEQNIGAQWASKNDPRVTRVGRFLRRSRLDEIPQILNILRGDIHLIGPRPERPEFIAQLEKEIPFYRVRLAVKPGLTGWAQVKYRYGSNITDAHTKLQYDLYYIKYRSSMLNLLILLKTVGVVLLCKGT